jgi:hypothetical protein
MAKTSTSSLTGGATGVSSSGVADSTRKNSERLPRHKKAKKKKVRRGGQPPNFLADAAWVYDHLGMDGMEPEDAPNPGAWGLFLWATENGSKFYQQIYYRYCGKPGTQDKEELKAKKQIEEQREWLRELREQRSRKNEGEAV